jgi:hypothetical protein
MSSGSDIWYGFEFLAAVDMFFAKIAINSSFSCVEFVIVLDLVFLNNDALRHSEFDIGHSAFM